MTLLCRPEGRGEKGKYRNLLWSRGQWTGAIGTGDLETSNTTARSLGGLDPWSFLGTEDVPDCQRERQSSRVHWDGLPGWHQPVEITNPPASAPPVLCALTRRDRRALVQPNCSWCPGPRDRASLPQTADPLPRGPSGNAWLFYLSPVYLSRTNAPALVILNCSCCGLGIFFN